MANKKNVKEIYDPFVALVNGGRTMGGVPLLPEVEPLKLNHVELPKGEVKPLVFPEFNEEKEYENFKKELAELREYYKPFLRNLSRKPLETRKETSIIDFDYRKETENDKDAFEKVLAGKGKWQKVKIPFYEGPEGRWNAYYRTTINLSEKKAGKTYHIDFEAVDYIAEVYLNGKLVTRHEGFFAPFTANVTDVIKKGKNVLLVVVKNDLTTSGNNFDTLGTTQYGNKIYAATGLGYDEPIIGWHHCPAGAGIIGKVTLIEAGQFRITDIWVRPDIDNATATINTVVHNHILGKSRNLKVYYTVEGRNFEGLVCEKEQGKCTDFRVDENFLTHTVDMTGFKLWEQNKPYLYQVTVTICDEEDNVIEEKQTHFGMRKFCYDENSTPKGKFYFNNKRIMLRGANEMGHLPRCVMENNYEQLIDDILIAKICNMNFFRITQRPVFTAIYDYMDMLGMMAQTDFPMFGNSRPNLFGETLKQTSEMEKLTRNHPSVVIESFCNETIDTVCWNSGQYRIDRYELNKLFDAMRIVCLLENPDRCIKYCDGDYAVIEGSYGLTDFHTYCLWYTSHTIPYGKLNKGYLPELPTDWMLGCGEYGTDALDSYELMKKYYPKDWLPKDENEPWSPRTIAKAQCYGGHGSFFPEQDYIKDWIRESREWQRKATKMYVHALRLRTDFIQSTAIHLLIDAWPAGWTKTLVDVDRIPKPGYYAFKEANIPARISLRRDKYVVYVGDKTITEVYAYNDLPDEVNAEIQATVYFNGEVIDSYKTNTTAKGVDSNYTGDITKVFDKPGKVKIVAKMIANGVETFDEVEYEVKEKLVKASKTPLILSEKLQCVKNVCEGKVDENIIFVDTDYYEAHKEELDKKVLDGAKLYIDLSRPIKVMDYELNFRIHILPDEVSASNLVWRNKDNKYVSEFGEFDFQNFYSSKIDCVELTQWYRFDWEEGAEEILYLFGGAPSPEYYLHKKHKHVVASKKFGKGEIILSSLTVLDGCIGINPALDKLFVNLIEK